MKAKIKKKGKNHEIDRTFVDLMSNLLKFKRPLETIKGMIAMIAEQEFKGDEKKVYKLFMESTNRLIELYTLTQKIIGEYYEKKYAFSYKPKVLIFTWDPFVREVYEKHFSKAGFEVKVFDNYDKPYVVDVVVSEKPDILYCDIIMEGMLGYEAIRLLKKDKRTKDIPIIILSNLSQKEDIEKGLKLGAVKYLVLAHYTPTQVTKIFKNFLIKTGKFTKKYFHEIEAKTKEEINELREKEISEEGKNELEKIIEKQSQREFIETLINMLPGLHVPLVKIESNFELLKEGEFKGKKETAHKYLSNAIQAVMHGYRYLYDFIGAYYKEFENRENEQNQNNKRPKILHFECDPFVRDLLRSKFIENGFDYEFFGTFQNFLKIVAKKKPDLIIFNIVMPDIEGWDAMKMLKGDERTKDIPFVVFTNLGEKQDIEKGLELGALDYFLKQHLTPNQFVEEIKKILKL